LLILGLIGRGPDLTAPKLAAQDAKKNIVSFFKLNSQEIERMLLNMQVWAFMLLQEGAVGFDVMSMWEQMTWLGKAVVIVMFIMSAWSIGVMIDRFLAYNAARKQSRAFAPAVAGALREGKLDEAIKIADRYKKSHLAKVVVAGLQEFRAHQDSNEIPGEEIEASKRALDRSEAIVHAELKRGVSSLATIGSTAPFVGLFGTVVGIINAFKGIATEKSAGLGAVAAGISEALVTTAVGLFVAVPAVWMFNVFTSKLEAMDVEMGNSSSELIDYFIKRSQRAGARKV
jgi:biopolymer transport protein ExbB/biopolymer transport protein TolQ